MSVAPEYNIDYCVFLTTNPRWLRPADDRSAPWSWCPVLMYVATSPHSDPSLVTASQSRPWASVLRVTCPVSVSGQTLESWLRSDAPLTSYTQPQLLVAAEIGGFLKSPEKILSLSFIFPPRIPSYHLRGLVVSKICRFYHSIRISLLRSAGGLPERSWCVWSLQWNVGERSGNTLLSAIVN